MLDFFIRCTNTTVCQFDKSPTIAILIFELIVVLGVIFSLKLLSKFQDRIGQRFLILCVGILIFEVFTSPMWHNFRLGAWAYVYRDVSWVLTIGWSALILSVIVWVDHALKQYKSWQRFFIYLGVLMLSVSILEIIVVTLGIRSYAPEVLASTVPIFIAGVPIIDVLYYVPVFTGLVISFYKYWELRVDDVLLIPVKKRHWGRSLAIAFLGIFLFEVMIEPMVENQLLPQWSYIFRDISILMTGLWIVIVWLATNIVEILLIHYPTLPKFLMSLLLTGALALPLESWFILNGYRVYGESAIANFTGFVTPLTQVPVEIAFAIPCYMALVIAFIRYWEVAWENQL